MDDRTFVRQTFWTVMVFAVPAHLSSVGLRIWLYHPSTLEIAFNAYVAGVYSASALIFWLREKLEAKLRPPSLDSGQPGGQTSG